MLVKLQKLLTVIKTVAEVKRITKDKILIVKHIDHARASGSRKQTDGFVPGAIKVLIRRIQRDGKHRTGSPFESNFRLPFLPYRSGAVSFSDIDDLFIKMALRQGLTPRRNFTHVGIGLLLFGEIEIAARNTHSLPRPELQFQHVADDVSSDHRDSFFGLELIVRGRSEVEMFPERQEHAQSPLLSPFVPTIILWRQPGDSQCKAQNSDLDFSMVRCRRFLQQRLHKN